MNDFYSTFDESFNNAYDIDFFELVDEVPSEDYNAEDDYELSDDSDTALDDTTPRGNSSCTFATSSRRHFDNFCQFLRVRGFNIMKSSEESPYTVCVYELTKFEADILTELFQNNCYFVPKDDSGEAA